MSASPGNDDLDLAARLQRMPEPDRTYLIRNLPLHLDEAGDARRLLTLAQGAFPRLKTDWTRDAAATGIDYRYYFRAALRAHDLPAALRLGRSRAGLSHLSDWLASGVLAGLLPYLGSRSKLWAQVQRAIAVVEPPTRRVERLTSFQQPGLAADMQAWLRREFDRSAAAARDTARTDFLAALAASERGAIDYILSRAGNAPMNEPFARALVSHLDAVCEGSQTSPTQALARIAVLAKAHREAFVAIVDLLAKMTDQGVATAGIAVFEAVRPPPGDAPDALLCAAAVSRAWAAQGELPRAEALARRCLDLVPPKSGDATMQLLYNEPGIQAAGRLLRAAAPFATVWPEAIVRARELAGRSTARSHRAQILARFVAVTPWIADANLRTEWLNDMLKEIAEFVEGDLDTESTDTGDIPLQLRASVDDIRLRRLLSDPIEAALLDEVLGEIDRVLASPADLGPFMDVIAAIADVHARVEDDPGTPIDLFSRIGVAASHSANLNVRIVAAEAFFSATAGDPTFDAAIGLASMLGALVADLDEPATAALASGFLDSADRAWCEGRPDMCSALAQAGLTAAVGRRNPILFAAVTARMPRWLERSPDDDRASLTVRWAAAFVVFGEPESAAQLLRDIDTPEREDRLQVAEVLLDSGAANAAADMLASDLPRAIDFDDLGDAEIALEIAHLLVRANGNPDAVALLRNAAVDYRARIGEVSDHAEELLLNAVRRLQSESLVTALLQDAENELVESESADASMAARWYVALALSTTGNRDAAKRAWQGLSRWRHDRQAAVVRERVISLLGDQSNAACDALLAAASAVRTRQHSEDTLMLLCRLVPHVDPSLQPALIDGIADLAGSNRTRGDTGRVLTALCLALTGAVDAAAATHALDAVLAAIASLPAPEREGDDTTLVGVILQLMYTHRLAISGRDAAILSRLCHRESGSREEERFREALAALSLRTALDSTRAITDASRRLPFVAAVAERAIDGGDAAVRDDALATLTALFDSLQPPTPIDVVRLAAIYAKYHRAGLPIAADLETRLRTAGPSGPAVAIVMWASHLANTPLQSFAASALAILRGDLDRFAATNADLQSLQDFLRVAPASPGDAVALFDEVAVWAATMPLVRNEDWRHDAFIQLLRSSGNLDSGPRSAAQRRALGLAASALPHDHWGWKHVSEALIRLPFDEATSRWAIAFWLPPHGGAHAFTTESVADLFVTSLQYRAGDATPAVVDTFLDRIGAFVPTRLNREAAAAALRDARYAPLPDYLRARLLHDYDVNGLGALTQPELAFLATLPLSWWEARSTSADVGSLNLPVLVAWIEAASRHDPASAWSAVVLATEWLSRDDARALPGYFLELCVLPSWLPDDVRQAVLREM